MKRQSVWLAEGEKRGYALAAFGEFTVMNQAEVAKLLGLTRQAVTHIERRAILKIRRMYAEGRDTDYSAKWRKYERQLFLWQRRVRALIRAGFCQEEMRLILFEVAACRAVLERAKAIYHE